MNHPNDPTNPDPTTAAWEEAMSRDFDARVRDLHEAPLDISSVKGKAHKIRRNRRAAVAGSVLGVAAIVTPFALLANGDGDPRTEKPPFVEQSDSVTVDPAPEQPDYVLDGRWHKADGEVVDVPQKDYDAAVLWDGQLVATYSDGEGYLIADLIGQDGTVVESFPTASPVVVNETATVIAWVGTDGKVMTRWDGGNADFGTLDMASPGEGVAWTAAAITGGPDCNDNDELPACVVYVNSNLGEESRTVDSYGIDNVVAPGVTKVFDATDDGVVTVINEVTEDLNTCGGPIDLIDDTLRWRTCDHQVQQVSPDGGHFAAPQGQYDGFGPTRLSILEATTGDPVATFERPDWTVGTWTWLSDGALLFTAYEAGNWHLMSMTVDGDTTELASPVAGDDFDSAFILVQH